MNTMEPQSIRNPGVGTSEGRLLIDDLIRYLSQLVALNKEDRTGNPELSDSLRQLAKALRPHANRSVTEFADLVRSISDRPKLSPPGKEKTALPSNLESLSQLDIEKILGDDKITKSRIVEIGERRFGIPRSRLLRSRKQDAVESIRAALDHERTLDLISSEAQRGGENRLS